MAESGVDGLEPHAIFADLFGRAKAADEFEYCCTLLRIRGMEDQHQDPFRESFQLAHQLIGMIEAPLNESARRRLLLFLYCHLTEIDDIYNIVANMLCIVGGDRYSMTPFGGIPKPVGKVAAGYLRNPRVDQLIHLAQAQNLPDVGTVFGRLFVRPVRNAFFHSDYVLSPDSFNIPRGEGVEVDNVVVSRVPLDWLVPRLEFGVNGVLAIIDLLLDGIRSYTTDKVVRGRFNADGSMTDIQLITDPQRGLYGFRSPPNAAE